ncbi:MAG TPA: glycoside hydrolase family 13 protein, partial [Chitinophagaceae bacterium]|nr:glycoside hydrolase family 13 protein [Chitinophagaceae bacterium]
IALCVILIQQSFSQNEKADVYPTNWWVGMKWNHVQLMVRSQGIKTSVQNAEINYPGVKLIKVNRVESPNYLFLDLSIAANTKPGIFKIKFNRINYQPLWVNYELKSKNKEDGKTRVQGVTSKDLIYLLMPDRFANGDTTNDFFTDMRDTGHDRNNPFDRHGGDLKGVMDHLDYLKDLGITTIWMTPVVENDMARTREGGSSRSTYHGYAFTDQYNVDKRFGGNAMYKKMVEASHAKGLKVIQDAVYNHVGIDHWFIRDMPMKDWVNQWPKYTNSSYKDQPLIDPYASQYDKKLSVDGWFTRFMPDLNQRNPYVANFLIQYAIWATEEFGIDGWRVDTYFYNDSLFLNNINDALAKEFPKLTVFGEVLVSTVADNAYFGQNNFDVPFKHNLQGVTDYSLTVSMLDGLVQPFGWDNGVSKVYSRLAQDFVFKDPNRNCIFLDNHDLDRFYSVMGEDFDKFKMGINWLLTLRGIPEIYYGTEILMKNFKRPSDAEVRKDFPGGWPNDTVNKFLASGRTEKENNAFNYISNLAHFRQTSSAITSGRLMQYVPVNGVYVYFRYDAKQTIMVISNTGSKEMKMDWDRFSERLNGFSQIRNVITGQTQALNGFEIKPKESFVFELMK